MKTGVNVKKEVEKLSKVSVAGGKLVVKEQEPEKLGQSGGPSNNKDPADLIDPYTL